MTGPLPYAELLAATALVAATGLRATAAKIRLTRRRAPLRRTGAELPELELAHLRGGPGLVADTVIIRMRDDGRLVISRDGLLTVVRRHSADPVEAELVRQTGPRGRAPAFAVRRALTTSHAVRRIGTRLVERGLLYDPRPVRAVRVRRRDLQGALALATLLGAVGWLRLLIVGHPVLPTLGGFALLLVAGALWHRRTAPDPSALTPSGRSLLERLRDAVGPVAASLPAAGAEQFGETGYAVGELMLYHWYTPDSPDDPVGGATDGSWADHGSSAGSWSGARTDGGDSGAGHGFDGGHGGGGHGGGDGGSHGGGGDSGGGGGD
ncbi:TIGR04222 domain-containing membrane protein [Kitasatospora sp. NPDC096147]|uniref:TIGR04222 domain-containing membrane protein n=1 Tax=Kitasatospora sp. NPDC096147 TaxID=3364093 RepID=UPI003816C54C